MTVGEDRAGQPEPELQKDANTAFSACARALELTGLHAFFLDADLRVAAMTTRARELVGAKKGEAPTLDSIAERLGCDLRAECRRSLDDARLVERGLGIEGRRYLLRIAPQPASAGVLVLLVDMSAARSPERPADVQRDRFLAMLSHELRNPLAAIGMAAHVLEHTAEPELKNAAAVLTRQTQHLKHLVDDLLDVSRVGLDSLRIRKHNVDLLEIVHRTLEAVEGVGRARGVRIEAPNELPKQMIFADPTRLTQMLTNLTMNAVKFGDERNVVRLEVFESYGWLVLRVTDRGSGFDPAEAERLFELFYQREQTLDRTTGGLGVGLSLARTIASAHGGFISAHSDGVGHGATFEVRLPMEATQAVRTDAPSKSSVQPPLDVVIVEDQQDNREMLSAFIHMRGHRVVAVGDGEEAVATILHCRPDLALVDIGLPGIDGYEVARKVRAQCESGLPFLVALTGYGRAEDRGAARAAGFDEHVVKPLSRQELERLISTAAQRRRTAS